MAFIQCEFIRANGKRCGSSALRGQSLCYHHFLNNRHSVLPGQPGYRLPMLEDAETIQVTITHLMRALILGHIDYPRARMLLHALQLAIRNIRRANFQPHYKDVVTDLTEAMHLITELKKSPSLMPRDERFIPLPLSETNASDR
jgi:hypothetical protein